MSHIKTERRGRVFLIGLDRGAERNRMDMEMLLDLSAAYTELEGDPELRCGIVYSTGRSFSMGLELDTVLAELRRIRTWPIPADRVDPFGMTGVPRTKPVICAVNGMCMTVGLELMLAADIVIAAESAVLAQMEVRFGVMPMGAGTMRWVDQVGRGNALRYLLTADTISAKEAHRIGLVQELAPSKELLNRAVAMAETIASMAPLAVRGVMDSVRTHMELGFPEAVRRLPTQALRIIESEDAHEGIAAFKEKRDGKYAGR